MRARARAFGDGSAALRWSSVHHERAREWAMRDSPNVGADGLACPSERGLARPYIHVYEFGFR